MSGWVSVIFDVLVCKWRGKPYSLADSRLCTHILGYMWTEKRTSHTRPPKALLYQLAYGYYTGLFDWKCASRKTTHGGRNFGQFYRRPSFYVKFEKSRAQYKSHLSLYASFQSTMQQYLEKLAIERMPWDKVPLLTERAGALRSICVDWTTSAACARLW